MPRSAYVPITRARVIQRSQSDIFETLAILRNHWGLSDGFEVRAVRVSPAGEQQGATVRVRGPFGLRRTVRTTLTAAVPPARIDGEARAGRSRVHVSWALREVSPDRTYVELALRVTRIGPVDRLLLAAGGRLWLHHELAVVLAGLERAVAHAAVARVRRMDVTAAA